MQNNLYRGLSESEIKKIEQIIFTINNAYFITKVNSINSKNPKKSNPNFNSINSKDSDFKISKNTQDTKVSQIITNSLPSEFNQPLQQHPILRNTARCIMLNSTNQICLLYSKAKDYYAIPGGGIEPGESLLDALKRETLEETGYTIKNPKPLGKIHEERYNRLTDTYFFTATPLAKTHTHYMEDEIEEDYELIWLSLEDTIKHLESRFNELLQNNFPSYKGSFINTRHLQALKFLKKCS